MKFERLIKLIREEKVSLFIGSGFSLKAGAPSSNELCKAIISQIDNDLQRQEHKSDKLSEITNYFVEEICSGSRNSLIELLKKKFDFPITNLEDHQALAKIPHFHKIFTTNYDTLLEDSYEKHYCQVIRKDADCAYLDKKTPVSIFKIHGDFINQDYVVITSKDYDNYFRHNQNQLMWNEVKSTFLKEHILFIGYGLEDDNIMDIIRNISKTINKNQKDMFLIAPGFNEHKIGVLRSMKVQYHDATAAEFLTELTQELRNNIWSDFKNHKISTETFTRFCNLHDIEPTVALQAEKENKIVQYKSKDGKELKHDINLTISKKYKEIIDSMDFEKYGVIIKNSPFPTIPLLKISNEDLVDFSLRVNDILIKDKVQSVMLAPVVKSTTLTLRIPARSFLEQINVKSYSLRKGKRAFTFECNIYKIDLTAEMQNLDDINSGLNISAKITFNEVYTNNNDAIKWIDILCAFFSREDIYINEWSDEPINRKLVKKKEDAMYSTLYGKFKTFYENIKQIELISGTPFTTYHNYNDQAFLNSFIIVSYLKHEPLDIESPNGVDITAEDYFTDDYLNVAKNKEKIVAFTTVSYDKGFVLNDKTFVIPNALLILAPSTVTIIKKNSNKKIKLTIHCEAKTYKAIYTDDPDRERMRLIESKE